MAKSSEHSPEIEKFLELLAGRTSAIQNDQCVKPPYGCSGPATEFRDALSRKEYAISGLCQNCQDKVFGAGG